MMNAESRLMIVASIVDALDPLMRAADDLAADDEINFGDLAQAINDALELASAAVRRLDRDLRNNSSGQSLHQVCAPTIHDWMESTL